MISSYKHAKMLLATVVVVATAVSCGYAVDCPEDLLTYANPAIVAKSDTICSRFAGHPDSTDRVRARELEVKDCKSLNSGEKSNYAAILGHYIAGEILLLDSLNGSVLFRLNLNIPSRYASFGDYRDINNDGVPELFVHEASGSHGNYIVFVSVFEDSLSFVRDDKGHYQFFASGGGIQVKDLDGDKVDEIILTEMVWGHDPSADADNPPKTIYRLQGNKYAADKKPE